jgi:hypothetical protein
MNAEYRVHRLLQIVQAEKLATHLQVIKAKIPRDAHQKSDRILQGSACRPKLNHPAPDFLGQILGMFTFTDHLQTVCEQPLVVAPEQR